MAEDIESPCVSVCFLDDNDICQGCYRSAQEITDWFNLDADARKTVLDKADQRFKQQSNIFLS